MKNAKLVISIGILAALLITSIANYVSADWNYFYIDTIGHCYRSDNSRATFSWMHQYNNNAVTKILELSSVTNNSSVIWPREANVAMFMAALLSGKPLMINYYAYPSPQNSTSTCNWVVNGNVRPTGGSVTIFGYNL